MEYTQKKIFTTFTLFSTLLLTVSDYMVRSSSESYTKRIKDNDIGEVNNKNILLLQGPIGFFFKRLDANLRKKGARTYRIGLNAGDYFFSYKDNYVPYKGTQSEWKSFIRTFLEEKKIDKVFLFGDCRFYQSILVEVAVELKIEIFVFEEGYIRPHYITLERFGVNNYSHIPRDSNFYDRVNLDEFENLKPKNTKFNPLSMWISAILYYGIARLFHFRYKYYKHHRGFSATQELFFGIRSLIRKVIYTQYDKKYLKQIKKELSKKYFFVPLQTHNDFQILQHSNYGSIEKFIIEVLESFAKEADSNVKLMFKHHPIDRGRKNYKKFIFEQSQILGISDRVLVIHEVHLPTCLQHALGTVTINSTVGLSSLYHGTPTIALGNAIYDIEGITNKNKKIEDFWKNPQKPNMELLEKFRQYIIFNTQLNGSFYGMMPQELSYIPIKREYRKLCLNPV